MSFDFATLVTDRLQSDVDERNAKGTYNAADLNRVTAAMEALDISIHVPREGDDSKTAQSKRPSFVVSTQFCAETTGN